MKFMFSEDDSIASVYGLALRVIRELDLEDSKGESKCRLCSKSKAMHLNDGTNRCSVNAMSREFLNDRHEERTMANRALVLIEELRSL